MKRLFSILTIFLFGCGITSNQANTMSIDELLTKERNQYLEIFKLGLEQYKTEKSASEVMLQMKADINRSEPEIFQLNRYDLINVNAEGKFDIKEFNLEKDSVLKFDKQVYEINGMEVIIKPFVWNGCEFTLDKKPNITYDNWAKRWIDMDDKNTILSDVYQNLIHSVTYPQEKNSKWTTTIDFGTAPIEAFKELMKNLSGQGIKEIEVHSKTFTD
jgi:hypothetical protein